MDLVLLVCARRFGLSGRFFGFRSFGRPLSAQAQTPSRPSGGDKEQKRAENEGSAGMSLAGSPVDRAKIAANRHTHPHRPKVAEKGKSRLNLKLACFTA
jgi:hypothetical protein